MTRARKLPQRVWKTYERLRLRDGLCSRQSSDCDEALTRGGGFIYFDSRNDERIPSASAKFLIDNGLLIPVSDGLFAETSQSFIACPQERFQAFRNQYEAGEARA